MERAFGSASMRFACARMASAVDNWPSLAAANSVSSGMLLHNMYDKREAIS